MPKSKSSTTPVNSNHTLTMKHTLLLASALLLMANPTQKVNAQEKDQIPLGLEAVTGYRTNYYQRSIELADSVLDFQIEGEVSLSNSLSLGYGAWYLTETGNGDFTEVGSRLSLTKDWTNIQLKGITEYRNVDHANVDSGVYLATSASYYLTPSTNFSNSISLEVGYDTAAEGTFSELEFANFYELTEDSYLLTQISINQTTDFYEAGSDFNLAGKVSYTYNLSKQVSVTPFIEAQTSIDNSPNKDFFSSGIYFEVSF
ncbi:hypothetical protein OAB00_00615 [Akkermansiaceae bacterium]|nr:hypothetical protein [Akkermansiaceae bacterium]